MKQTEPSQELVHVLLCGGSGSRLWPLSRTLQPKQFIPLFDDRSLFQKAVLGNRPIAKKGIVVCNEEHQLQAERQLTECGCSVHSYILEPIGRNTAGAVALALQTLDSDDIVLITPCDHQIDYSESYLDAVRRAQQLASEGEIVLFGIVPHAPETGYGYIEADGESVKRFHEKPSLETALHYVIDGNFFWNSGMLCSKVSTLIKAFDTYAPDILKMANIAFKKATKESHCIEIPLQEMAEIPSQSIDYAILEKLPGLKMVRCAFRWSDLGSFDSLFVESKKDDNGNVLNVKNFYSINAHNNLMISKNRTITAIDVENLVVVDTKDALLISRSGSTQKVKEIVELLAKSGSTIHHNHIDETRPWGSSALLEQSEEYEVRRLIIEPGEEADVSPPPDSTGCCIVVSGKGSFSNGTELNIGMPFSLDDKKNLTLKNLTTSPLVAILIFNKSLIFI